MATYRKTHLCDVEIPGQGPMRESNSTIPGPSLESPISTPAGKVSTVKGGEQEEREHESLKAVVEDRKP